METGEQMWKLGNGHVDWGTGVERYSQHVVKALLFEYIHSFIHSAFQRSSKVDIELVIKITIGTVQNES